MLTIPIMFFDSGILAPELNFEEQDKNFLFSYLQLTFEEQDKNILMSSYIQLTFENQNKDLLFSYPQLTFENQLIGAL